MAFYSHFKSEEVYIKYSINGNKHELNISIILTLGCKAKKHPAVIYQVTKY